MEKMETEIIITSCGYLPNVFLWLHNVTYVTVGLALLILIAKNRSVPWSVISLLLILITTQVVDTFILGSPYFPTSEPCPYLSVYHYTYLTTIALFCGYFLYEHRQSFMFNIQSSLFQADLLIKLGSVLAPFVYAYMMIAI